MPPRLDPVRDRPLHAAPNNGPKLGRTNLVSCHTLARGPQKSRGWAFRHCVKGPRERERDCRHQWESEVRTHATAWLRTRGTGLLQVARLPILCTRATRASAHARSVSVQIRVSQSHCRFPTALWMRSLHLISYSEDSTRSYPHRQRSCSTDRRTVQCLCTRRLPSGTSVWKHRHTNTNLFFHHLFCISDRNALFLPLGTSSHLLELLLAAIIFGAA